VFRTDHLLNGRQRVKGYNARNVLHEFTSSVAPSVSCSPVAQPSSYTGSPIRFCRVHHTLTESQWSSFDSLMHYGHSTSALAPPPLNEIWKSIIESCHILRNRLISTHSPSVFTRNSTSIYTEILDNQHRFNLIRPILRLTNSYYVRT